MRNSSDTENVQTFFLFSDNMVTNTLDAFRNVTILIASVFPFNYLLLKINNYQYHFVKVKIYTFFSNAFIIELTIW